jgi:hypothetical protein
MIAMLFLQAMVTVVPPEISPVGVTPAFLTKPIELYECRMVGITGEPFNLSLRKEGEQGFYEDAVVEGKRKASRTPLTYRIVKDDSGRLSAMTYHPVGEGLFRSDVFRDEVGNKAPFKRFGGDRLGWDTLELYYYSAGSSAPQRFGGPCKVTRIRQMPLDRDPTKGTK